MGLFSLAAGLLLAFVYLYFIAPRFSWPCAFFLVSGLYCPGCGGTRAVEALFHGKLLLSLWYHPLVLYGLVLFVGFMGTQTLERLRVGRVKGWKFHKWYLFGALAVVVGNWLIKNVLLLALDITL